MEFKRARNDKQRTVRMNQIVDATLDLYETLEYEEITLTAISEKLDFSRVNLYKYVSTKEDIFLLIIARDTETLMNDVMNTFEKIEHIRIEDFSLQWTELLLRHKRLIELYAILNTVIVKRASVDAFSQFEISIHKSFAKMDAPIMKLFPELTLEHASLFIAFQMHYAMGLYPATVQSKRQEEIKLSRKIPHGTKDFIDNFSKFLTIVLRGLMDNHK